MSTNILPGTGFIRREADTLVLRKLALVVSRWRIPIDNEWETSLGDMVPERQSAIAQATCFVLFQTTYEFPMNEHHFDS